MSVRDGEGRRRSGKHCDNKFAAPKWKEKVMTNSTRDVSLGSEENVPFELRGKLDEASKR